MGFIQNFRKLINLVKIYAYNLILRDEQIKIWKEEERKGTFCVRKILNQVERGAAIHGHRSSHTMGAEPMVSRAPVRSYSSHTA